MLRNVAVAVCDWVPAFELGVVCEVFGLDRTADGLPGYDFAVCAAEPPPLRTTSGFLIDTPHGIDRLAQADLIAIPAWRNVDERPPVALLAALRAAVDRGARVMSVCSGAFVLAAAGLLDGRRATTHWRHVKALAEHYPAIRVEPDVLYIDEGSVLTSAGTAAGIDLCLHIVRQEFGAEVANAIARRMVVPAHRDGGQAQYIEAAVPDSEDHNGISLTPDWAQRHLAEPITLEQLAKHGHISALTLAFRLPAANRPTQRHALVTPRIPRD